jgi:AcrR family transcriptional regulator
LPPHPPAVLEPRKSPVQARSAATVNAVLEATIQVLLQVGKERLTTTKVAGRAGVSVGTLYQYFPNKSAMLKAALRRHLDEVTDAIERACHEQKGNGIEPMATALMTAFLTAKMRDVKASIALYSVSSDIDGVKIAQDTGVKVSKAVVAMLKTAREQLTTDPELVALMLQGVMAGVSRRLLESSAPEKQFDTLLRELIFLAHAYLNACSIRWTAQDANA